MQRPICYYLIVIIFVGLGACAGSQEKAIKSNSSKNKSGSIFVEGLDVREDAAYENVKGNLARLQTMLCGKFVHHVIPKTDSTQSIYQVWLVNEGRDSVVHYYLPIGNRNKEGYWIYIHQCLTSLPDAPTFAVLANLKEIDRDTIVCSYYSLPKDFETDLVSILKDPKDYFREFDLISLQKTESSGFYNYLRKSPLHYLGEGTIFAKEVKNTPIRFIRRYYDVTPKQILSFKKGYGVDTVEFTRTKGEYYLREARVKSDVFLSK